jgi:hypothetical protein
MNFSDLVEQTNRAKLVAARREREGLRADAAAMKAEGLDSGKTVVYQVRRRINELTRYIKHLEVVLGVVS